LTPSPSDVGWPVTRRSTRREVIVPPLGVEVWVFMTLNLVALARQ
jgi:hypothetical protein